MNGPRCPVRDPYEIESWVCYMPEGHDGAHRPELSEEAKDAVLAEDSLNGALFEIASLFHASVTNNGVTWLGDEGTPIYCVGEFIGLVRAAIDKHS